MRDFLYLSIQEFETANEPFALRTKYKRHIAVVRSISLSELITLGVRIVHWIHGNVPHLYYATSRTPEYGI